MKLDYTTVHRRRGQGGDSPPKIQVGGHRPPNFTHCLHNELHCSIVDVVPDLCPLKGEGNHIFVV